MPLYPLRDVNAGCNASAQIEFLDALPKTPSGKMQRFVLRQCDRQASSISMAEIQRA
jgi:acyl-coenzyme A synthetase/AMP-(fatty) acid ligase